MAPGTDVLTSALQNKSCKRCKSNLVGGVKCSKCENFYHLSCAKLCSFVKFINKDIIVCCESELTCDEDITFFDAIENMSAGDKKADLKVFSYIVKQKDAIIDELRDKVKLLYKQLEFYEKLEVTKIKEIHSEKKPPTSSKKLNNKNSYAKTTEGKQMNTPAVPNNSKDVPESSEIPQPVITTNQVAVAILENETRTKCNKYINLVQNDEPQHKNQQWKEVTNRRSKRQLIVGNNKKIEVNGVAVKGVPKTVILHVYRVEPSMKPDDLKTLLIPHFPEVICEAITPKHPHLYSSFKVHIYEQNFDEAMDPQKWPSGAYVQRFFQLRKRPNSLG